MMVWQWGVVLTQSVSLVISTTHTTHTTHTTPPRHTLQLIDHITDKYPTLAGGWLNVRDTAALNQNSIGPACHARWNHTAKPDQIYQWRAAEEAVLTRSINISSSTDKRLLNGASCDWVCMCCVFADSVVVPTRGSQRCLPETTRDIDPSLSQCCASETLAQHWDSDGSMSRTRRVTTSLIDEGCKLMRPVHGPVQLFIEYYFLSPGPSLLQSGLKNVPPACRVRISGQRYTAGW